MMQVRSRRGHARVGKGKEVSKLVGVLSPVNHQVLYIYIYIRVKGEFKE